MVEDTEFWSSVEYGTFLKGLVRELGGGGGAPPGEGEKVEGGKVAKSGGAEPGTCQDEGEKENGAGCTFAPFYLPTFNGSACQRFAVTESAYRQARGTWARLGMRWRCYVGYPLQLRRRVRREGAPLALVVCTNTFFAPWVAMRAARKRGIPVVHWMFDLFPDVLVLAGKLKRGSLGERLLRKWVRAMFDGAAANVFLGEKLLAYAEVQFGPIPRGVVIPVGCDAAPFADKEPTERKRDTCNSEELTAKNTKSGGRSLLAGDAGADAPAAGLRPGGAAPIVSVLYCGNLGRMHDVDTLVGAVSAGVPDGVHLSFRGNGAGFAELTTKLGAGDTAPCLTLGGSLPEAEWLTAMAAADVALVTMKPGAEGIVMPSKTYSAMAAGQAILAVCPRESDLADTVLAHDCGWVVAPGDAAGLRTLLESLPSQADEVLAKRRNAWRAARECYDQRVLAVRWRELLEAL